LFAFSLLVALIACNWTAYGPRDVAGPDQRSDLLAYFKKDATNEQIKDFWHTVIGTPGSTPDETRLLPGMRGVMTIYNVQGYEGVAVDFWSTATQNERDAVKARVLASSIVFKVLEHTIPNEVTILEQP
jgi:hypothetical protein